MWTDPFRELDRMAQQMFGGTGTPSRPVVMPMEAYRAGEEFQFFFGEALDTDNIEASYDAGVLTLRIPVVAQPKPRKVAISAKAKQLAG